MTLVFEGIKIIETAQALAGPMAGRLLADWGADVIHIEHPVRGDLSRSQRAGRSGGRVIVSDIDYRGENYNRNKRGITLDLARDDGRGIIYRLLEKADVFICNFRQRELEKFKLDYDTLSQLNPRLICANVCGYGKKGPDKNRPAYEHTSYFARSGMHHVLQMPGSPPVQVPPGLGDNVAALALVFGIMMALFMRDRTGAGQEVDVSLFNAGVFAISYDISGALAAKQDRQPIERKDVSNALMNSYQTKDGRWLWLGISQPDPYWSSFCRAIGREDLEHDPRFESFDPRVENHVALFHILEEVFRGKTLEEWKACLNETGLLWSPVQSLPEVIADPQARVNDLFVPFDHPAYGRIEVVANPVKLGKARSAIRMPSPELGQHTEEVLLEHGYTWEDIARFKERGVIA